MEDSEIIYKVILGFGLSKQETVARNQPRAPCGNSQGQEILNLGPSAPVTRT